MAEPGRNAEVVRALLEAFTQDGVEAALEHVDEGFVGIVGPDVSAEPDTYRGHDGVRRYFAGFAGAIEDVRYEIVDIAEVGSVVIAEILVSGRGSASGIEVSLPGASTWEVRDGRVTRMEAYADAATARAEISAKTPRTTTE